MVSILPLSVLSSQFSVSVTVLSVATEYSGNSSLIELYVGMGSSASSVVVVVVVVAVVVVVVAFSTSVFLFTYVTSLFTLYLLCLKVEFKHFLVRNIGRCMHLVIFDCGCCLQYRMQQLSTNGIMNRTMAVHVQIGIKTPGETSELIF